MLYYLTEVISVWSVFLVFLCRKVLYCMIFAITEDVLSGSWLCVADEFLKLIANLFSWMLIHILFELFPIILKPFYYLLHYESRCDSANGKQILR